MRREYPCTPENPGSSRHKNDNELCPLGTGSS
nr:hypothetical protein [Klebsiella variicola]